MNDGSKLYISKNKNLIVKLHYIDMKEVSWSYKMYDNHRMVDMPEWFQYISEAWTKDNVSLETFFKEGHEENKEVELKIKFYRSSIYHVIKDGDYIGKVIYQKNNQFNQEVLNISYVVIHKEDMEKYFEPFIIDDYIEGSFKEGSKPVENNLNKSKKLYFISPVNDSVLEAIIKEDKPLDKYFYRLQNVFDDCTEAVNYQKYIQTLKQYTFEPTFADWLDRRKKKYIIVYDAEYNDLNISDTNVMIGNCHYFSSRSEIMKFFDVVGKEEIKKYMFGINPKGGK